MFNFRPSVRPVPLQVHINGFPGKHYCPRMATMNKPTFGAIRTHSPDKPTLIFVSSRRQTRLTALDLIAYLAAENDPKQWLHMPEEEVIMKYLTLPHFTSPFHLTFPHLISPFLSSLFLSGVYFTSPNFLQCLSISRSYCYNFVLDCKPYLWFKRRKSSSHFVFWHRYSSRRVT